MRVRQWGFVCVLAAFFGGSSLSAAIGDRDLVGAWFFDEDTGGVAVDSSSQENHGEIIGNVNWTPDGRFGGALEFAGNDSWVSVPDDPSLQFPRGTDFTVAAWLRTEMAAGEPPMIVAKNYQPAQVLPWYALYYANLDKLLDGSAGLFLRDAGGSSFHISAGPKVNDGEWHHLAGTREGGTIRYFVDGNEEASMDGADFDVGTNDAPLHFMSHLNRWLVGALDEVVLFRRALSGAEINALMTTGLERFLSVEPRDKLTTQWGAIKHWR